MAYDYRTFWVDKPSTADMLNVSPCVILRYESELKTSWSPCLTEDNQRSVVGWPVSAIHWMDHLAACVVKDVSDGSGSRHDHN